MHVKVDYKEKAAAGGQIPRNFFRKDARMSDRETLVSRRMGKFHDCGIIAGWSR